MKGFFPLAGFAAAFASAVVLTACSGAPTGFDTPAQPAENVGTTRQALSGNDAVARGELWVAAQVPYCQSPNGQPDSDPSCSATCSRPSNPDWDPYRSDCSGFVSWAWDLPAPGRTTSDFAPAVTDITQEIDGNTLMPGDALNIPGDHMVLFVAWNTPGSNATFYEEPGCSSATPYATSFTSDVSISGSSVTVSYEGKTFTAIRYGALSGTVAADGGSTGTGATPCVVTSTNESGTCISTTDCANQGGTSTPGYCPGAADIQCCTGVPTGNTGGGGGGSAGGGGGAGSGGAGGGSGGDDVDAGSPGVTPPNNNPPNNGPTSSPGGADAGASGPAPSTSGPPSANEAPPFGSENGSSTRSCSAAPGQGAGTSAALLIAPFALVGLRRAKRRRR